MEENENVVKAGLFLFFIVLIIVSGSIMLFISNKEKNSNQNINDPTKNELNNVLKKDKEKDFIYYTNEEIISDNLQIIKKVPIINIASKEIEEVEKEITSYVTNINNNLKPIVDADICDEENIVTTNFLDYATYTYKEYITLLLRESSYDCKDGISTSSKVKSYTFDVKNGKYLDFNTILKKYNVSKTEVLEKIEDHLEEKEINQENILIEETIDDLKEQESIVFYINEYGELNVNYVVKTDSLLYNDTIIISNELN